MWIRNLHLLNWQKHENLQLNFTEGVNYLYGSSDSGKSCIRRSIAWLFGLEKYSEEDIRRESSKRTSVKALLDNGIECERVRSSSINRFILRVPGKDELVYDSIGSELPQDVINVLKINLIDIDEKNKLNLNISSQITLPFLLDIPGSLRMKLFNKISGQELIDILVQNFNREVINIRRNLTIQENIITVNQPEIEKLDVIIKDKRKIYDFAREKLTSIAKDYKKLLDLTILNGKIKEVNLNIANVIVQLNDIKIGDISRIACLKVQNEVLKGLITLKKGLNSCSEQLDQARGQLAQIKAPTLNSEAIRGNIERLNRLKSLFDQINAKKSIIKTNFDDLNSIKDVKLDIELNKQKIEKIKRLSAIAENIKNNESKRDSCVTEHIKTDEIISINQLEYKEILKTVGICPVCKQSTKNCEVHI